MTRSSDRVPSGPVGVAVLGSTGSVGTQTIDVIRRHPDRFRVVSLAARDASPLLREQVERVRPDCVALTQPTTAAARHLPSSSRIVTGSDALVVAATLPDVDIVVTATSGHAAIPPTHAAVLAGKTIALANKETLVCAGDLIMPLAASLGVEIRPVDSEHSAIWQAIGSTPADQVARLVLTASGGPFRAADPASLRDVTAEQALAHPTWRMGGKITVDSATMMNKGLEVIEAHALFGLPYDQIDVVVHPESIVHSLVEFVDRGLLAQLGWPDMRVPIQYALTHPDRLSSPAKRLSLAEVGALHFEPPSPDRFPALGLAKQAGEAGGTYPTVLSAADEVAVGAFLAGRLRFTAITDAIRAALDAHTPDSAVTFDTIADADRRARAFTEAWIDRTG